MSRVVARASDAASRADAALSCSPLLPLSPPSPFLGFSGEKLLARVREGALIGVHELVKSDAKLLTYRDKTDSTALLYAARSGNAVMTRVRRRFFSLAFFKTS